MSFKLTQEAVIHKLPMDIDYLLEGANTWCRALAYKYLGALVAAHGDRTEAEKHFNRALSPIQEETYSIIRFIKMTIYAEAYRSLGNEYYCNKGKELASYLQEEYSHLHIRW